MLNLLMISRQHTLEPYLLFKSIFMGRNFNVLPLSCFGLFFQVSYESWQLFKLQVLLCSCINDAFP